MLIWKDRDVWKGAGLFSEHFGFLEVDSIDEGSERLSRSLQLSPLPRCTMSLFRKVERIRELDGIWQCYLKLDLFKNPVRYLLAQWCVAVMDFVSGMASEGGTAEAEQDGKYISYTRVLDWDVDICDDDVDSFVGELLRNCMSEAKVHEVDGCSTTRQIDRYHQDLQVLQ